MNIVIVDVEDDNLVVDLHENWIILNKSIKLVVRADTSSLSILKK